MHITVGTASLNQTPLDWERNKANIQEALELARRENVQVLCLPEMAITGYGCEDHFLSQDVHARAWKILRELVNETSGIFTCFGVPMLYCNALYNVIVVVYNREILGIVPKQHLAGDGLHYEPRWFKPWPAGVISTIECGGDSCPEHPIGDLIFRVGEVRIGFEICEDAFVAARPGARLAQRGVDIIMNPSASHFAFGKFLTRERLVVEGSRAFNVTYLYANLLGNEAGRAIYDGDCLIASCGDLLARGPCLNLQRVNLTTAVVDLSKAKTKQVGTASFTPILLRVPETERAATGIVKYRGMFSNSPIGFVPTTYSATKPLARETAPSENWKYDEFTLAITLGLWDYLTKSHSKGFVISLSGGADSAACAVLVRHMITRAVDALGFEAVCKQFKITDVHNEQELAFRLLTCVYQSTANSSDTTFKAARAVAEELGAKFSWIDIEVLVQQYTALAEAVEGRKLMWETDDLALQNIQARARAPSIWMVANVEGKLLITTSNRSEAAVGYCTMDGDTAGSIAPIGGIDKAFLLDWLRRVARVENSEMWISKTLNLTTQIAFDLDAPPVGSALELIIKQKPTAELRPGQDQTDEGDLMPYNILDAIETWAILEKKCPREVYDCLRMEFKLGAEPAVKYVKKFFTLWVRNQWKRERFAIAFHVDNHNLDPKTWCRFPVLSGGFQAELAELDAILE